MKALIITLTLLFGSSAFSAHHEEGQKTKSPYSKSALIKIAMAAAPSSISANAAIMDYDGTMLRNGTNDWVCGTGSDAQRLNPMCLDEEWRKVSPYRARLGNTGRCVIASWFAGICGPSQSGISVQGARIRS